MTRRLWFLAAGAMVLRAAAAATTFVISHDGSRYLRMARLLGEGRFGEALGVYPQNPPLYPLLIAMGDAVTGSDLFAASFFSVVLGGLAVLPLHAMVRAAWGERVADVTALLYLFLPSVATIHGEVMLEGTFMFFFFSSMSLAWSALERKSWEQALLAGACATLAWLARPEGMYLPALLILAVLLKPSRFALAAAGLYLATAFLIAYPYMVFIKTHTGRWALSASPFASDIMGLFTGKTSATGYVVTDQSAAEFDEYRHIRDYGRVGGPAIYLARTLAKNLFYVLVPFLLIGFCFLRPPPEGRWGPAVYILAAAAGYFLPAVFAFVAGTPFSHRYILPTCVLLLPVAAIGLFKAGGWTRHEKALPVFLVILCAAMMFPILKPKRADKTGIKTAGRAILDNLGSDRRILSMPRTPEYYARGEWFGLSAGTTPEQLARQVEEDRIDVIVFSLSERRKFPPGWAEAVEKRYRLLGEYPQPSGDDAVRVYVTSR